MTSGDLLGRILAALDTAGIPSMLTGSFASSFHGNPRATRDIDFVIAPDAAQLRRLISGLPPGDYYVDEDAALDALARETQFNVVDLATGWKIDLIIRKSRPFSTTEFGRRQTVGFEGATLAVATLEDLVIAKLEWARQGSSARQLEDVAALLRLRGDAIDHDYVARWVRELRLGDEWAASQALK